MKPSICWRNLLPVSEPPDLRHSGKQVRVHVLHLDHLRQAHLAVGAADAAELEPAVRRLRDPEARDHVVDHHRAGFDLLGHRFAATTVGGPHTGSQPEVAVIGQANGLLVGVERRHRQHRAEGFLLDDAHVRRHIGQQRRRVEVWPQFGQALSAPQQARAMQYRVSHMLVHNAQLALVDERPHFDLRPNSVAHTQLGDLVTASFEELLVEAAMNVTALDRKARLAGIHERAPQGAAGSNVHVGIVEHDHGIFAAQLQHDRQQLSRRGFSHAFAGGNAAGEDELVDGRIDQRRTGGALADHHLHQIGIQARCQQQPLQLQRDQRREFRRLQDDRVARDQCAERFRGGNGERIIPGRDNADYAKGLAQQLAALGLHGEIAVRQRFLAQEVVRVANAELGCIQNDQNFGGQCFDCRLTGFAANQVGNLIALLAKQVLESPQHRDSLPHRSCLPCRLGLLGAQNGILHIACS